MQETTVKSNKYYKEKADIVVEAAYVKHGEELAWNIEDKATLKSYLEQVLKVFDKGNVRITDEELNKLLVCSREGISLDQIVMMPDSDTNDYRPIDYGVLLPIGKGGTYKEFVTRTTDVKLNLMKILVNTIRHSKDPRVDTDKAVMQRLYKDPNIKAGSADERVICSWVKMSLETYAEAKYTEMGIEDLIRTKEWMDTKDVVVMSIQRGEDKSRYVELAAMYVHELMVYEQKNNPQVELF